MAFETDHEKFSIMQLAGEGAGMPTTFRPTDPGLGEISKVLQLWLFTGIPLAAPGGGVTDKVFFGALAVDDIKFGASDVAKVFVGSVQVWPPS